MGRKGGDQVAFPEVTVVAEKESALLGLPSSLWPLISRGILSSHTGMAAGLKGIKGKLD